MRILVVNPNTTRSMTAKIGAAARAVAGPGTEIGRASRREREEVSLVATSRKTGVSADGLRCRWVFGFCFVTPEICLRGSTFRRIGSPAYSVCWPPALVSTFPETMIGCSTGSADTSASGLAVMCLRPAVE